MVDIPAVQLKEEPSVAVDESFVVGTAVIAASVEATLEPRASHLDVIDGKQAL